MKLNIKEDRKEINKIIENCLPLMKINSKITQDCADSILVYLIDKNKTKLKEKKK